MMQVVRRIGHQVGGVFGSRICEGRNVQLHAASFATEELAIVIAAACGSGDHGVDVVDIALVIIRNGSTQLGFQVGICLVQ